MGEILKKLKPFCGNFWLENEWIFVNTYKQSKLKKAKKFSFFQNYHSHGQRFGQSMIDMSRAMFCERIAVHLLLNRKLIWRWLWTTWWWVVFELIALHWMRTISFCVIQKKVPYDFRGNMLYNFSDIIPIIGFERI